MVDRVPDTLRDWGKLSFWVVSVIVLVLSVVAVSIENVYPSSLPTDTSIFSSALPVLVNMIGFLLVIFIFMVQNITREYAPELSKEVYKDKYLMLIFSILLLITLYNLIGVYFDIGERAQSVGFILTVWRWCRSLHKGAVGRN